MLGLVASIIGGLLWGCCIGAYAGTHDWSMKKTIGVCCVLGGLWGIVCSMVF